MDGGYTWDCLRGCTRTGTPLPDLKSISVNVRLGGFGYSSTYYSAIGNDNIDGISFQLLNLDETSPTRNYEGLDVRTLP
jgi:hypothetical protein